MTDKTDKSPMPKREKAFLGCFGCSLALAGAFVLLLIAAAIGSYVTGKPTPPTQEPAATPAPNLPTETPQERAARIKQEAAASEKRKRDRAEEERLQKLANAEWMRKSRAQFAKKYESALLDKGMDAYVTVGGKDNTILTIKYALASRPLIHQISKDEDFTRNMGDLGFERVMLLDGLGNRYWVDYK